MRLLYTTKYIRKVVLIIENIVFNLIYKNKLGSKIKIFGFPVISWVNNPNFKLGKNITLISNIYFSRLGINHPVFIRLLNKDAQLQIGDNVGLNGASINVAQKVSIGNNVLIGNNVSITDTDHHAIHSSNRRYDRKNINSKPILIEDNVFIGKDAIILKGVTIGENSIIGAGSVVTKSVPPNEIWAGNPAKYIKKLAINN